MHLVPGLLEGLRAGIVPCLHDTRYLLLEPSHHVAPPRFEESVFQLVAAGYVPVITHPERLTWVEDHYAGVRRTWCGKALDAGHRRRADRRVRRRAPSTGASASWATA